MAIAPRVHNFTRNFGRGAQTQQEPSVIRQVAGDLGKLAILGALGGTAHGLGQILNKEDNISPVSEAVTSDVGEPEPRRQRNPVYTKENYGNPVPDPTSDPNFYSEVASHDFGSPTGDGFVEPTVRIPVRREEPAPTTEKYQRTTVLPEGNYGKQVGTVGSLQGGQDEILGKLQRQQEMSEAGDKALDEVEKMMGMGTIPPDVRESLKEEAFGAVDNNDFVNEFIAQLTTDGVINDCMPTSELSEIYSNLSDAASDPDFKEGYNRIAENLNSISPAASVDPSYANRIEEKYSIPRISRTENNARLGAKWADAAWREEDSDAWEGISAMKENAALDQAAEDAIARDDYHEEQFGIQGSPQVSAIVEGPETVIQPANESKGFLNAFAQEVKDFDHGIPWKERTEQALEADSALGAAGIMIGTGLEKGAKDVGTRAKKIVTGVPKSIDKVKNIASDIGETVTREIINSSIIPDNQMQPSKWAEAARLAAGFPALGGSGGVEIGNESDLSDNAQADDLHQQNEQNTPAGINRQTSGLGSDPVEGEMQTIAQAVNDLATSFGKGLAHLSPEERVDIARKMIEDDLRKDGYKGPINFG